MTDVAVGISLEGRDKVTTLEPLTAERLCGQYLQRIYKFAQLVSRDSAEAEDLAQDALERALRGLRTFDPSKGDIEGWLWRIVINAARDAGRLARRRRLIFDRLVDRFSIGQQAIDVSDHLAAHQILAAVRALSPRARTVIALRYGADLDYRHIGRHLGISEAAASMAVHRALAELRIRLSREVLAP